MGQVYKHLSDQQEAILKAESRQKCLTDLHYLAKHVLGYDRLTDHYHKEMAMDIDTPQYKFKLLLHPRGHFKSTIGTESYPIKKVLEKPNSRILITNAKLENSRRFLATIAKHFNENLKFRWIWRDWWLEQYADEFHRSQKKDKLDWITRDVQDELYLLRPSSGREASFTTGATDASLVSQHYSCIIADDLVNRDYVRTQEMVEKSILYFKDLLDLLDPDGELMLIGTRWSHVDLYSWIISEFGHKSHFSVPDRVVHGNLAQAIEDSKVSEEPKNWMISICPTSEDHPVFPEEFNSKVLRDLLQAKGPYEYGAQYELDPTPSEFQKFQEEWFNKIDVIKDSWLKTLDICITVDPAISVESEACNSAIAVCGYDENNYMYLLDGINEKLGEDDLPVALFELVQKWTQKGRIVLPVGFESIGFQQLYIYTLERMMLEKDFFFGIEEIKRRSMSKDDRILRLVPRIKNGFFTPKEIIKHSRSGTKQPYDLVQKLKWELLKFPYAGTKDLADALADQLDIVKAHRLPKEQTPKEEGTKREFVHRSIREDKMRMKMTKPFNDAVGKR